VRECVEWVGARTEAGEASPLPGVVQPMAREMESIRRVDPRTRIRQGAGAHRAALLHANRAAAALLPDPVPVQVA